MHVLITRPLRDAQMTAQALRARGHEVLISPVLEIIGTGASIATTSGGPWDGVIATSAQAFDYLDTEGRATIQHLPMFVVGTRTAQAAHNTGSKDIRIIAPHASELVIALAKQAPQHFLYLAGQDRKSDLEDGLAASGHALTALVVYEARAATGLSPKALGAMREGRLDAVLHYSRRSAALFAQLVQQAGLGEELYRLRHVCISRDAADGMSQHCVIAKSPDQEGLFAALELG